MKWILILIVLAAVYLFFICPSLKHKDMKPFLNRLYAHRGLYDNASDHPENSLKAFQAAIDHKYGIEMDVQLSSDGVPVVFHDFRLDRVARDIHGKPVHGKVSSYTLAQLKQFHLLQSEEKIPTMAEFLKLVDGRVPLIVEYKIEASDQTLQVCAMVDEMLRNYKGAYMVESFNPRGVLWYRKHHPEVVRGQLSEAFHHAHMHGAVYWMLENLLFNFLTKPDFIAYKCSDERNWSRRICRSLYHNCAVAWTIQSQQELDAYRDAFDLFIFEGFEPENEHAD